MTSLRAVGHGVGHDQPVERIARPAEPTGRLSDGRHRGVGLLKIQSIFEMIEQGRRRGQFHAPDLDQYLDLDQHQRRDPDVAIPGQSALSGAADLPVQPI